MLAAQGTSESRLPIVELLQSHSVSFQRPVAGIDLLNHLGEVVWIFPCPR
jgi:hypothetical protein